MQIHDVETLKLAHQAGEPLKWLFFWGHQPSKDGVITKSCLSQWWAGHPFDVDGITYLTVEHYMMAEKARLFCDEEVRTQILQATSPRDAKSLGRQVKNFNEERWNASRIEVVIAGNLSKFQQHGALREFLLETSERILVEASPHDQIWGIGISADDPASRDPSQWRGLNLLGFALMAVREHLSADVQR